MSVKSFNFLLLLKTVEPLGLLATIPLAIAAFVVNNSQNQELFEIYVYSVTSGTMFLISLIFVLIYKISEYYFNNSERLKRNVTSLYFIIEYLHFGFYFFCFCGFLFLLLNIVVFSQVELRMNESGIQKSPEQIRTSPIQKIVLSSFGVYLGFTSLVYMITKLRKKGQFKHPFDYLRTFGQIALIIYLPLFTIIMYEAIANTSNELSSYFYLKSGEILSLSFLFAFAFCLIWVLVKRINTDTKVKKLILCILLIGCFF